MSPETVFQLHLVLGTVAWLLLFGVYVLPRLRSMDRIEARYRHGARLSILWPGLHSSGCGGPQSVR